MLQTKESDTGIIFGTPLDLFNEKLAHNIKQTNIATAFDNVHCLDFWMGIRTWIDTVFSEEQSINQHCLRLIQGAITEKSNRDRNLELSDYRRLDNYLIFKLWNSLHPQNTKTFPQHTWRNNPGQLDAAGNAVVLDPPVADRTSYLVPFSSPSFNVQVADTWDPLSPAEFELAVLQHGFYAHHLRTRGFIFDEATRNASFPFRKFRTLTSASPTADILSAAHELNVYNQAFERAQRDRSEHASRLKDDEAKKRVMKSLTDRIFGPSHQQAISSFKQAWNFNGIRLYFKAKYGVLTDSTVVIDEIRKALTTPSTYSKCTSVADLVNTWEMLSSIFISLEHNHRGTPEAHRPTNIHEIRSSLYKDSLSYSADHPHTPRIISYADSRAYFLFPFEISRYSRLVRKYKTEELTKTIEHIKAVLEREEDADHKDPQRSLSSAVPTAFMLNASSEPGHDELLAAAAQDRNSSSSHSPYTFLLPSSSIPPSNHCSSLEPTYAEKEAAWNLHALAVFSDSPASILHTKPCPICKLIGRLRHPEERANAEQHSLYDCPILPKIAHLPSPNLQGYPTNLQARLPPYSSILPAIHGASISGMKRELSGQPKTLPLARESVRDQIYQRLKINPHAQTTITSDHSLPSFPPS